MHNTHLPRQASLLEPLFHAATQEASSALQRWTGGELHLTLSELGECPLDEAANFLDIGDELLSMVVLTLQGDFGGQIILTFDKDNGRELAATILGRQPTDDESWRRLEISALNETGNILSCAYLRAISNLLGRRLVPSPPQFMREFGASMLEQALMSQAMSDEQVLLCRTTFQHDEKVLNWNVVFVPEPSLLRELRQRCASNEQGTMVGSYKVDQQ